MKNTFASLVLLGWVVGCNSPEKSAETTLSDTVVTITDSVAATTTSVPQQAPAKIELVTQDPDATAIADTSQKPMGTIRLVVNGQETWQKQVPGTWKPFDRQYSKTFNVPENAVSAYTASWQMDSYLFYLIQDGNKWVVKSSHLEEGTPEGEFEYTVEKEVPNETH